MDEPWIRFDQVVDRINLKEHRYLRFDNPPELPKEEQVKALVIFGGPI
jgi:hypothetical protein